MQQEVLRVRRKMLDPGHRDIAVAAFTLGETLTNAGRLAEAETLLRESVTIRANLKVPPHAEHAWALNGLGWALYEQGRYEEAERTYREAVDMFTSARDAAPKDRSFALDGLGETLWALGKLAQAEQVFRQSLEVRQAAAAPPSDLAWSHTDLGRFLCEQGRTEEGAPLADAALKVRRRDLPPRHKLTVHTEIAVGKCLVAQKRFEEAEALLTQAFATVAEQSGPARRDAIDAAAMLSSLYERAGKPREAAAWRAKAPR